MYCRHILLLYVYTPNGPVWEVAIRSTNFLRTRSYGSTTIEMEIKKYIIFHDISGTAHDGRGTHNNIL